MKAALAPFCDFDARLSGSARWLKPAAVFDPGPHPAANQLLSGKSALTGKRIMSTATTAPRSSTTARRDEDTNEDDEEMRGNRWRI